MKSEDIVAGGIRRICSYNCYLAGDDLTGENASENRFLVSEQAYDENGNLTQSVSFTEDGQEANKEAYQYDQENRVISKEEYIDGEIGQRFSFVYGEGSKLAERHTLYEEGGADIAKHTYDEVGRLIQVLTVDEDGEEESREDYRYNEQGHLLEEAFYSYGNQDNRAEYEYDEEGRKSRALLYNEDDQLVTESTSTFDENGKEITVKAIDHRFPQQSSQTSRTYDAEGRIASLSLLNFMGEEHQTQT